MQEAVFQELQSKIQLAFEKGLLDNKEIKEIEFNLLGNGQALSIEIWKTIERRDEDHTIIDIPVEMQHGFIFKNTVKPFK